MGKSVKRKIAEILKNKIEILIFLAISVMIIVNIFSAYGYIFTLDFVTGKNHYNSFLQTFYAHEVPVWGGILLWKAFYVFILIATDPSVMQIILLSIILFLSALSMHSLASAVTDSRAARFYAGLLYMLNPYTYIRLVVGHWLILFAYAVLPLALKSFIEMLDRWDRRSLAKAVFLTSLVAFNAHTLFIAFLIFGIIVAFRLYHERSISLVKPALLFSAGFLFLNAYWLIPALAGREESLIANISGEDLAVFAPKIASFSALFTLASMHGFWRQGYIYAKDFIPFWQLLFVAVLFLAVHGLVSCYRDKRQGFYVKAFFAIWAVGLILAAGIRSPFAGAFEFLFDHLPLIKGMRDTHKFVTMLALSYAYLGALGLTEMEKTLKKPMIKKSVAAIFLIVPLLYSFTFFNGFAGQIKATDYPDDWYKVSQFLSRDEGEFKVLFLPWHLYMDFHWVPNKDKRIANPAPHFFDKEVISAKNIEVRGIYRQVYTPVELYIDYLLANRDKIDNFGELVSVLNVKYILLTKEADYEKYFFLFNQSDLELVMETENFYVFRNREYIGRVFSVDSKICVKDMEEFLELSREIDIRKALVLVNVSCRAGGEGRLKELKYRKVSPVKYVVEDKPLKYIVLAEEYHRDWRLDGKKPLKAYGAVNAWEAEKGGGQVIRFERFYRVNLPSYIISVLTFLFLVIIFKIKR